MTEAVPSAVTVTFKVRAMQGFRKLHAQLTFETSRASAECGWYRGDPFLLQLGREVAVRRDPAGSWHHEAEMTWPGAGQVGAWADDPGEETHCFLRRLSHAPQVPAAGSTGGEEGVPRMCVYSFCTL